MNKCFLLNSVIKSHRSVLSFLRKTQKPLKGVLNPNFRPCSFEFNKNRLFKMKFDLSFKSSVTSKTEDILKLFFPLAA